MKSCHKCGKPIKDKIDWKDSVWAICSDCVQIGVNWIRMLERETGIDVINTEYLLFAYERYQKSIKSKLYLELRQYMKENGISNATMAALLGVSRSYLSQILNGRKPLTNNALAYLSTNGTTITHTIPLEGQNG